MYKKSMLVIANGQELELYTIGHTAKLLKKSVETIRAWERQKIIPKPMYRNKQVRLYHPLEVEAMRKVIRRLGKYAKKEDVQKHMWIAIKEARQEILNVSGEDHNNGNEVPMPGPAVSDEVQQGTEQESPQDVLPETEVQAPSDVSGL